MGRKPGTKAKASASGIQPFLDAIKFVEPAQRDIGNPNQTHCVLSNKQAVAFDGLIAIGCPIDSDIAAIPQTKILSAALSKCTERTQITQLGDGRIVIKSGKLQAYVPCLTTPELLTPVQPDLNVAAIDERVIAALNVAGELADENAQHVLLASVMLKAGSAIATDRAMLIECWHGVHLPTVILPKAFIVKLSKISKRPIGFGFSPTTATFWFEDRSWIRTQLYNEPWPDMSSLFNRQANPAPIPAGLWDAIEKLYDLADEHGRVYFAEKSIRTKASPEQGASCEIDGSLPANVCFNIEYLNILRTHINQADFCCGPDGGVACLFGPTVRAFLCQIKFD